MFQNWRVWMLMPAVMSSLLLQPSTSFAQIGSEQDNAMIYSPGSSPYGMAYGEWTAVWWKWFLSIPTNENPINDQTGELCTSHQEGPVWFLVGSGGGKTERSCEVPAGKAILIPAIIVECSYAEDNSLQTKEDLRMCAQSDQDLVSDVWATVDGVDLPDELVYRVDSPLFDFTFIEDNVFSAQEGPTQAVSDGFWLFIKPLPPGSHDIHVGGLFADYAVTAPFTFVEDSTYHLSVTAPDSYAVRTESVNIGDESVTFSLGSSSEVTDIGFDEQAKQLSFTASEGITTVTASSLLEGPFTVVVNGESMTDYGTYKDPETGETILTIAYEEGNYETVITGTNVVPEFPITILLMTAAIIGSVVIAGRIRQSLF